MQSSHLVLVGPTASGKSAVALELARRIPGLELVTVDSMQVYRSMDIGTAKPTAAERAEIPHHLLDLVDPTEDGYSVVQFKQAADEVLADIEGRGRRALLVGGTGLYVQAVVDRLEPPGTWPDIRAELEADPAPATELHERLVQRDPVAAGRMEPTNRRRIVRALEVTLGSGRPFSSFGPGLHTYAPTARFRLAGVWLPRPVVTRRIRARFRQMLDDGLMAEVQRLAAQPLGRTARQALGYKELLDHLEGTTTLDDAVDTAIRRTTAFARRQRVWFRRDPRIAWYGAAENPLDVVPALLGDWMPSCN